MGSSGPGGTGSARMVLSRGAGGEGMRKRWPHVAQEHFVPSVPGGMRRTVLQFGQEKVGMEVAPPGGDRGG